MSKDLEVIEELKKIYPCTNDKDLYKKNSGIFYSEKNGSVIEIRISHINFNELIIESLLKLTELEILDLSRIQRNRQEQAAGILFSEKFGIYEKLRVLKLSDSFNLNTSVLTKYKNLNELFFKFCDSIELLFKNLINLKSIEKLSIKNSSIENFPNSLFDLKTLKELDISWNQNEELLTGVCNLQALEILRLDNSNIQRLPECILNLSNLHEISLRDNKNLRQLPNAIGILSSLGILDLNNSSIELLPESISNLTNLWDLDLSECRNLLDLPEYISYLNNLEYLNLADCKNIRELPRNIGNLFSLKSIRLYGTRIQNLPPSFSELTNLKELNLAYCENFREIPEDIGNLKSLEIFILTGCDIQKLPDSIFNLSNLKELDISHCKRLRNLPDNFESLISLETLSLAYSVIYRLPESFAKLSNLKKLNLSNCENLLELPKNIYKLSSLETFSLKSSSIQKLPDDFSKLPNLKNLSLSQCKQVQELPNNFGKLISLEYLTLDGSNIQKLPKDFSKLSNLKDLNLTGCNNIWELPDDIGELDSLECLNLTGSSIRIFPKTISNLSTLTELDLSKTRIERLNLDFLKVETITINETSYYTSYLENDFSNSYIRKLDISSTNIRKIHKIIESSKSIESLHAPNNGIQFIPDSILELRELSELALSNNRIEYISPEVCRYLIDKGIELKYTFENNPLKFPKYEILEKGNQAVLDFLEQREKLADTLPHYRVILAGEGGAGKSSLVDVITDRGFDDSKETTNEIRVIVEPFEEENMTVHFWDFGGQKIMHSAHKMFFTEDCLYLIVLDSRKEEKPDEWLRFISSKIKNKKAIIVLNKTDMNPNYDLDIKSLRIHYPFIIGLYKVSCQNKEGIDILKKDLFEVVKKDYLQPPVENWGLVKQEIIQLRNSNKLIERSEFDKLCKKHGISKDKNLADYFHKIGFIFNALNNQKTVLNTEWLIKGIYPIITNKTVIQNNGKICVTDYPFIFRTEEEQENYSEYHFLDILDLMKKNDLSFEEEANQYIIPALLPEETPDNLSSKEDIFNQLKIYIEYKNYLNPSILFQFIARMHKASIEKLYWRGGIWIEGKENSAIIQSDENSKRIEIIVQGKNKRKYFEEEILPKFREIHKEYILQYEILIDIPVSDSAMTLEVNYEELLYLLEISSDKIFHSYKTKRKYDIDKIFENSVTAVILPKKEDSMEELIQIMNKKLDELSLQMDIKEEKYYETDVKEWLKVADLQIIEEENRKRIINAESLRDSFIKKKAEDYSMYIAQTCRAIEGELKRKFFINTFKKDNYEEIKTELVTKFSEHLPANSSAQYDKKGCEEKLMLGSMIAAYEFYQLNIRRIPDFNSISFFEPYRDFNLVDDSRFKALLNDVRENYRNKAAHSDFEIVKYTKEEAENFREKAKEWFSLWLEGWKK